VTRILSVARVCQLQLGFLVVSPGSHWKTVRPITAYVCANNVISRTVKRLFDAVTGDVGGYLGLLIGGSLLTVMEILDLVFYNAYLKFMGKA